MNCNVLESVRRLWSGARNCQCWGSELSLLHNRVLPRVAILCVPPYRSEGRTSSSCGTAGGKQKAGENPRRRVRRVDRYEMADICGYDQMGGPIHLPWRTSTRLLIIPQQAANASQNVRGKLAPPKFVSHLESCVVPVSGYDALRSDCERKTD